DRFLKLGSVEIVVADPQPKVFLAATDDAPTVQDALERLARDVVGRDLVVRLRSQSAQGSAGTPGSVNALLMDEEKLLLRTTLGRLAGWANTRQGLPGALYLVSDGGDLASDFYGESQREDFSREGLGPTGGEVISSVGKIESALDRLSDLWLFTYQVERPPDGKVHRLKIRSRSKDVVVRTARVVSAGTPAEVAGTRALDALLERGSGGDLAIALRIETGADSRKSRKTRSGRLEVRVKLGDLPRVLEKLGAGEMRVTVAVWEPKTIPFVHHDQKPLEKAGLKGDVWFYTAPIEWPAAATRFSVFVEELKTGASGSAIAGFPAD
ncbi:MAG: hypothetical protein NEA02_10950, partial [Thermoanaerobaculia bacterium]|nr:hypothetical protein [Thermoanaerobaculia bacterium]